MVLNREQLNGNTKQREFQPDLFRFIISVSVRSVTSDLGCQSPEEGQRFDRKFEVCPNSCVEIMGLDSIFISVSC